MKTLLLVVAFMVPVLILACCHVPNTKQQVVCVQQDGGIQSCYVPYGK